MLEALAALGGAGSLIFNGSQLARRRPRLNNAKRAAPALDRAFDKRVDELVPGRKVEVELKENTPAPTNNAIEKLNQIRNQSPYASSTTVNDDVPGININPNADRVYLAHELGHIASQQTDVGHFVNTLRANPKLKTALLGAMVTVPGVAAALEAGDEDMDTSLATAVLANAPTLADEVLASKNGLAMMDTAGMRASLGQRGKLASGLLSYLALPLVAGVSGNLIGNQFDQDI